MTRSIIKKTKEKRAEPARLCKSMAALLRRLLVHGTRRRRRPADRLDRTFDRSPQPADFRSRAAFRIIFAGAFAVTERQQQIGTVGDLTAPHRRTEFYQGFTGDGDDAA